MNTQSAELTQALATVRARALVRGLSKVEPTYANDAVFIEALANRIIRGTAAESLARWLAKSGDKAAMARFRACVIRQAKGVMQ